MRGKSGRASSPEPSDHEAGARRSVGGSGRRAQIVAQRGRSAHVKAAIFDVGNEFVGVADHRFGCSEHQATVGRSRSRKLGKAGAARVGSEIEQHVAAQDRIEAAGMRRSLAKAVNLEAHRIANRRGDPPLRAGLLLEPAHHLEHRQAALHLELRIEALARLLDRASRHVGAEDVDLPILPARAVLREAHRQRIDLLAGRASGAPDRELAFLGTRLLEPPQRPVDEQIEGRPITEEISLVVEQSLDHLIDQRRLPTGHERGDQLIQRRDPAIPHQRFQRRLDPPAPAHRQLLAGARLEQGREDAARRIAYFHSSFPPAAATQPASSIGGLTAEASPASATARGMPHTALLALSCTRMLPPRATTAALPTRPSRPIPLKTTPSAFFPNVSATAASIVSTEGMQPELAGVSTSVAATWLPWRRSPRCASPGAISTSPRFRRDPSRATRAGRPEAASIWRAKKGMNTGGRCWVIRIGTSTPTGRAARNSLSA